MARRHLPVLPEGFEDPALPKGTYSSSQHNCYDKCGKAYEFKYVLGIPEVKNGAMYKGTVIHAGAEFSLRRVMETQKAPPVEEARAIVADAFEAEKDTVQRWDEGEDAGRAKDATIAGYVTYHRVALPARTPEAVEEGFAVRVGDVPVVGYIDLVERVKDFPDAHDPGRLVVADLKYSSRSWSQADIDQDPQFTLYSLAKGIADVRVDNLVPLKAGPSFKQLHARRTRQDHEVLIEAYGQNVDLIKKGVFKMATIGDWMCQPKWCGYWSICRGRKR